MFQEEQDEKVKCGKKMCCRIWLYHIWLRLPYLTVITLFDSDYHILLRLLYMTWITIFDTVLSYLTLITIWPRLLYLTQITIFDSEYPIWLWLPYFTQITVCDSDYHIWLCVIILITIFFSAILELYGPKFSIKIHFYLVFFSEGFRIVLTLQNIS